MAGPWEKYQQQPQFGGRPVFQEGPPVATPQTPEARANTVANTQRTTATLPFDVIKARNEAAKSGIDLKNAQRTAVTSPEIMDVNQTLANVIDNAINARNLSRSGYFATGFGASLASMIGGTPANDVQGYVTPVASNIAFDKLQRIRQTSPTGGAVGNVSDRDMELLKGTIADLSISQSDAKFQQSMNRVIQAYGRVLAKLPGGKELIRQHGWGRGGKQPPQKPQSGIKFLGFEQ